MSYMVPHIFQGLEEATDTEIGRSTGISETDVTLELARNGGAQCGCTFPEERICLCVCARVAAQILV